MAGLTIHGERPVAVPVPGPGVYWVRLVTATEVPYSVRREWTWAVTQSTWVLVLVSEDGWVEQMGSDVGVDWEAPLDVVVEVGPKLAGFPSVEPIP